MNSSKPVTKQNKKMTNAELPILKSNLVNNQRAVKEIAMLIKKSLKEKAELKNLLINENEKSLQELKEKNEFIDGIDTPLATYLNELDSLNQSIIHHNETMKQYNKKENSGEIAKNQENKEFEEFMENQKNELLMMKYGCIEGMKKNYPMINGKISKLMTITQAIFDNCIIMNGLKNEIETLKNKINEIIDIKNSVGAITNDLENLSLERKRTTSTLDEEEIENEASDAMDMTSTSDDIQTTTNSYTPANSSETLFSNKKIKVEKKQEFDNSSIKLSFTPNDSEQS